MAVTSKDKLGKFKEWFINSTHNTSQGAYRYSIEPEWYAVRFLSDNKVMRFAPNGKSFKKKGV